MISVLPKVSTRVLGVCRTYFESSESIESYRSFLDTLGAPEGLDESIDGSIERIDNPRLMLKNCRDSCWASKMFIQIFF